MDAFLEVVRALSHRERVRIIKLLQLASMGASELAEILGGTEADVRDHISVLLEAGLAIATEGESRAVFHINPDRSNLYGAVILALLDGWFNDEPEIQEDQRKAEHILGRRP